jgi:toxin FitB
VTASPTPGVSRRLLLSDNALPRLRGQPRTHPLGEPLDLLYVSTVTLAEIRFGSESIKDANRRAELTAWLTNKVRPLFAQRVLDISEDVLFKWRLLVEEGRKAGHAFSQPDLFIAATALHHGLTVVSRDTHEYERTGAPVFNPWES